MPAARHKVEGLLTRERVNAFAFGAIALIVAILCWLTVESLAIAIVWGLALAVITAPLNAALLRRLRRKNVCAGLTTLLVTVMLVVPATLAGRQVVQEAVSAATKVQQAVKDGSLQKIVAANPRVAAALDFFNGTLDMQGQLGRLSEQVPKVAQKLMAGSLDFLSGVAVALFLLFFFLRDREQMLDALRGLLPLSGEEAGRLFRQVDDTIYAIFYGTLAVALVQGALGGLMFWWLGLPAPILWGSAMALLAIVPVVGTALVWGPAAVFLLLDGDAGKALALVVWGLLVIGFIDNLLQPAIVKDRLRVHIVPVFIAMLGGLAAFGATGVILGPLVLSLALVLIEIWRDRVGAAKEAKA